MNEIIFSSLTKEQLYEGYSKSRSSAQSHWNCAKSLAEIGEYGIANSHIILGAEEAVKSILILAKYLNIETNKSIAPIFNNHKAKHYLGKEINEAYRIIFPIINILKFIHNKKIGAGIANLMQLFFSDKSKIAIWWDDANALKNNGFYVGYNNNQWVSPNQITLDDYNKSLDATRDLFEAIVFFQSVSKDELKAINELNLTDLT